MTEEILLTTTDIVKIANREGHDGGAIIRQLVFRGLLEPDVRAPTRKTGHRWTLSSAFVAYLCVRSSAVNVVSALAKEILEEEGPDWHPHSLPGRFETKARRYLSEKAA